VSGRLAAGHSQACWLMVTSRHLARLANFDRILTA